MGLMTVSAVELYHLIYNLSLELIAYLMIIRYPQAAGLTEVREQKVPVQAPQRLFCTGLGKEMPWR